MNDTSNILIEEYKIYVEMSDRISTKRAQSNMFFITIISGLFIALAAILKEGYLIEINRIYIYTSISILGILICLFWNRTILSYKKLNDAKFKVIHELEEQLPFACYTKEWDYLKENKYGTLTSFEIILANVLCFVFIVILFYSLILLIV